MMTKADQLRIVAEDMHLYTSTKATFDGRNVVLPDGRKTDDIGTAARWLSDAKNDDAEEGNARLRAAAE